MTAGVLARLRAWLGEPELVGIEPDSPEFTRVHRRILERKPLLRALFTDFCRRCWEADQVAFADCAADLRMEIGSGAGVMAEAYPQVLTSDVKFLRGVEIVTRAEDLPFADASLRALYAVNVFHHVSDPRVFFREVERVVAPGGGVVMIEPYYGPFARLLFRHLFTMESYEMEATDWPRHAREQVASDANQALSYVVLKRDLAIWQREFPNLELVRDEPHTHLSYLLTGGVNFRQLVPRWLGRAAMALERRLGLIAPLLALEHTVVVRKRLG